MTVSNRLQSRDAKTCKGAGSLVAERRQIMLPLKRPAQAGQGGGQRDQRIILINVNGNQITAVC